MDASQYKDFIMTLLFMKYVSDKYAGKSGAVIEMPEGGSFADTVALKGKKEIGEGIDRSSVRAIRHRILGTGIS
jgi:type I restriction enzyme M protein